MQESCEVHWAKLGTYLYIYDGNWGWKYNRIHKNSLLNKIQWQETYDEKSQRLL